MLKVAHPWRRNWNTVVNGIVFSFNEDGVASVKDLAGAKEAIEEMVRTNRGFFIPEEKKAAAPVVEPKIEPKVEPKEEPKIEPKVEVKAPAIDPAAKQVITPPVADKVREGNGENGSKVLKKKQPIKKASL